MRWPASEITLAAGAFTGRTMDALQNGRATWTPITFRFTTRKDGDEVDGRVHRSRLRWSPRNSLISMVRRHLLEEHGPGRLSQWAHERKVGG